MNGAAPDPRRVPDCAVRVAYRVPYADTDAMGYVYYGHYLTWFERCRNELLRAAGLPYAEMEARGFMLPVLEAHVDYRLPARYDDEVEIAGWLDEMRGVRCRVRCAVLRGGEMLCSGWTVHACVSAATRRPVRFPPEAAALLAPFASPQNAPSAAP